MALRAIDRIVSCQAFFTGSVTDGLSHLPLPRLPDVRLVYPATASRPQRPYPLVARVYPSGHFIFGGNADSALPQLTGSETLPLSLLVTAAGYTSAAHNFSLTAAQLARQPETVTVEGNLLTVMVLNAPLLTHDFALMPLPVHLAGRVVEADNRDVAIANAQVRVMAPTPVGPVTTNGDGFFTLQNLPVALSVTIRVTHVDFNSLETNLQLDFRFPVNRQQFALTT